MQELRGEAQKDRSGSVMKYCLEFLMYTFFIRTSNFGVEAERSYFFHDLRLKMFLRRS